MEPTFQNDELPDDLAQSLRSLGGVSAPPELWDRVVLALSGEAEAPPELWWRVAPAVRRMARPGVVVPFRRLAAAAALFVALGVALFAVGSDRPELTAQAESVSPREALREHYRSRVVVLGSSLESASPAARQMAASLGAGAAGGAGQ